jgi:hypothetical protein
MRNRLGSILVTLARTSFLLHVAGAAVVYGLTREEGIRLFQWTMGSTLALWLLGCAVQMRTPRTGFLPAAIVVAILVFGWGTTGLGFLSPENVDYDVHPQWLSDLAFQLAPFDLDLSWAAMLRTTVLLGAFLMALDLLGSAQWTRALLVTVGLTACGMVGFFYLQKTGMPGFQLKAQDGGTSLSFATYRYWGNGASFLNLFWPVLAGIALHTGLSKGRGWSLWMAAALLVFSALYVNLSKAGQALGLVGLLALAVLSGVRLRRRRHSTPIRWSVVLAAAVPIVTLLVILPFAMPWDRWNNMLASGVENNGRTLAYQYFVKLIPDAGWFGFGPGTFREVYWGFFQDVPVFRSTPFWVAHQDYIQTLVEWGYLGSLLWAAILVPATILLLVSAVGSRRGSDSEEPEMDPYLFGWKTWLQSFFAALPSAQSPWLQTGAFTAVLLTALHAAVDFPMQIESLQFYFLIWIALGWRNALSKRARRSR